MPGPPLPEGSPRGAKSPQPGLAERRELGAVRLERRLVAAVVLGPPDVLEAGELRPGNVRVGVLRQIEGRGLLRVAVRIEEVPGTITQAVGSPFSKFSSLYGE